MNTPKRHPASGERVRTQLHPNFAWINRLCCAPTPDKDIDARSEAAAQMEAADDEMKRMVRKAQVD
jgi:hypothetical protein